MSCALAILTKAFWVPSDAVSKPMVTLVVVPTSVMVLGVALGVLVVVVPSRVTVKSRSVLEGGTLCEKVALMGPALPILMVTRLPAPAQ